ncbi:MAG: hypothetical protein AB9Q22_01070 [Candidatus Reddybacter sp.]
MQQRTDTAAELELALLQINQLQEELEHYYMQNIKLQEQSRHNLTTDTQTASKGSSAGNAAPMSVSMKLLRKVRLSDNSYTSSADNSYNKQLQGQLNELKKATQISELKSSELASENELLLLQVSQIQEELESNHKQLEIKSRENLEQVSELSNSNQACEAKNGQLHAELTELKVSNKHIEMKSAESLGQFNKLKSEIQELTDSLVVKDEQIFSITKQRDKQMHL